MGKTINQLLEGVYPAFALLAGMELELFTFLGDDAYNAEQIASALSVQTHKLRPLLYALVVARVLTVENDLFSNTAETNTYLVKGKPDYVGGTHKLLSSNWGNILKTAATIRSGGPTHTYDYHDMSQEELTAIFRGLYPGAVTDARRLMKQHDFSTCQTLLDVGGGSGALTITITKHHPHLRATVVDLPLVTPIAQQFIEETGVSDQVDTQNIDVVQEELSELYDVIVARHVAQVLSEEENQKLVNNLASALNPGGTLHLIGWVLDNSRLTPQKTVNYNLILLNGYQSGQAYTEAEYYYWLNAADLEAPERIVYSDGTSIITARKPTSRDLSP